MTLDAKAWISEDKEQNGIEGVINDSLVLLLRNMKFSLLRKATLESEMDRHAAAHLWWTPDFDFIKFPSLFRISKLNEYLVWEETALLLIPDSTAQVDGITPHAPHLDKFGSWLSCQAHSAHVGTYPLVPSSSMLQILRNRNVLKPFRVELKFLANFRMKYSPLVA
jgi:hypothetical protein